jgi:probable phosphoglycerate mutase
MQVNVIRHLPTEWNQKDRLQGRRDIPIRPVTRELQRKIAKNKKTLHKLGPFQTVLASTLQRTKQTAGHYGYRPVIEPLLDELDFGPFEGMQKSVLYETFGKKWFDHPKGLHLGESLRDFEQRIEWFLEKYKNHKNMLIFGHGAWTRALISYHQTGNINGMNKLFVENNECITLNFELEQSGIL